MTLVRGNAAQIPAYCDSGLTPGSDCAGAAPIAPVYAYADDALARAKIEAPPYFLLGLRLQALPVGRPKKGEK